METPTSIARRSPSLELRKTSFEDVPEILRLIGRAVAFGCREHYDPAQRAAVHASYARALFVESLGPFETVAAALDGRLVAFAQLDPSSARLRALFVDADVQRHGVGRAVLAEVESRAARHGCSRLHGAMSLNAVPFYERAGFRRCDGPDRLATTEDGVTVPVVRMEKRL
jgi:GNAT superfamily N-acetyltransferase